MEWVGCVSVHPLGDFAAVAVDDQAGGGPVDEGEVGWDMADLEVGHDRDGEHAEGVVEGVSLREPGIVGGVGSSDEHGGGVVEPARQAQVVQGTADINAELPAASRYTKSGPCSSPKLATSP